MGAIFSYGFNIADDNFKNANCELFTLTNYSTLLDIALASNYISSDAITPLEEWRSSPSTWKK